VIVVVERLSHSYGPRNALKEISFEVSKGEIFGILGPNGGGKSTLFRILSTLMPPRAGKASIAGFSVLEQPREVRRHIGVVFQTQSLDRRLTVHENLDSQGRLFGLSGNVLQIRIQDAMERLGLADRQNDIVATLSGGLKRRVEIAKALLHEPDVLLMDEPSTGLDPAVRRELWRYLDDLRRTRQVTILLTTHILEEADLCDRLLLLHEGRVVAEGTPQQLKSRVGGDIVILDVPDPEEMHQRLKETFAVLPQSVNGRLRIEVPDGAFFLNQVLSSFPNKVESIEMHRPTLEDVFLNETGVKLEG
jgi:ABC-type multidrug transport system, ATPase component